MQKVLQSDRAAEEATFSMKKTNETTIKWVSEHHYMLTTEILLHVSYIYEASFYDPAN